MHESLVSLSQKAQNTSIMKVILEMDVQENYRCLFRMPFDTLWAEHPARQH